VIAATRVVDIWLPGVGSLLALLLGGAYHVYRLARSRRIIASLAQGVETARAVLARMPQGRALDAEVVRSLVRDQGAAGVLGDVSRIVRRVDHPAARMAADEMLARLERPPK